MTRPRPRHDQQSRLATGTVHELRAAGREASCTGACLRDRRGTPRPCAPPGAPADLGRCRGRRPQLESDGPPEGELRQASAGLSDSTRTDVIAFDCFRRAGFGSLTALSEGNRAALQSWVDDQTASGATGTGPAVAFGLGGDGYSECMVYILVRDGSPNCVDRGYD